MNISLRTVNISLKTVTLSSITVILSSIVYFYSRSKSATLPDPILINFEKQKVASFSDFWSIYDKDGNEVSFKKFKKKVLFICYVSTKSEESLKQLESLKKVYDDYKTKMVERKLSQPFCILFKNKRQFIFLQFFSILHCLQYRNSRYKFLLVKTKYSLLTA